MAAVGVLEEEVRQAHRLHLRRHLARVHRRDAVVGSGGEFGPAWHEAGLKTRRQLIYDDFAAVAKDLIARKITSPRRLGIQGGSNGGLLMGVEFVQHPELWRAVDIQVPLLDMLRFEKIGAGASWVGEYGSVSVPAERAFWEKTSPYQNLKGGTHYPEPLIWTTTKDDRVGPQHARKFAAKMAQMGLPYLYYEVIEGGHGSGANQRESEFGEQRPGLATLEADGHINGGKHHGHGDDRPAELARRRNGGGYRRHPFLQVAIDIFDNDNGVVDNETDSEH